MRFIAYRAVTAVRGKRGILPLSSALSSSLVDLGLAAPGGGGLSPRSALGAANNSPKQSLGGRRAAVASMLS
jgi:hypothetical protein